MMERNRSKAPEKELSLFDSICILIGIVIGAGISYAMGSEHPLFSRLGTWSPSFGTPVWALLLQGCLSLVIISFADSFIDTILYTAPVVWLFFLASGLSLFVLRRKEPQTPRPYRVAWFPFTTIVFCLCCLFMLFGSFSYALATKPTGLLTVSGVLLAGFFLYWFTEGRGTGKKEEFPREEAISCYEEKPELQSKKGNGS